MNVFGRRVIVLLVVFAAISVICMKRIRGADDPRAQEANVRKAYADMIRQTYNFPFAKDKISLPGNAAAEGGDFLEPTAFPDAAYCGHCHQEAYHEWRQALHSNAFRTPFYRASVNILIRTKGIEFARHCDSCHNPIGVLGGALNTGSTLDRSFDRDGLTCATCHSIQSVQTKLGNGSFVMGVPSVMVDEQGNRIPASCPTPNPRPSRPPLEGRYPGLLPYSQFCSACHKANLPIPLNDYKWLRAFTAYDEWQNSKFSKRNPLTFYSADFTTCQGCHMKREAITLPDYGAKHGTLASHRWLAGNTAVPYYYGFDEQLTKTIEFLKSGNYLNVDLFALKLNDSSSMIAPLGTTPFTLKPDDDVKRTSSCRTRISATRSSPRCAIFTRRGPNSR